MSGNKVFDHITGFWPHHSKELFLWELGPINEVLPEFQVCRISPQSQRDPWVYVSIGVSDVTVEGEYAVEFVLLAPDDNARHIETMAMVAHYHATMANKLDLGQIVNSGRPWLGDSKCDHLLVSLPYPFGPSLEWCQGGPSKKIRFLWLLPITPSEVAYAEGFGVELLEQRFDEEEIEEVDPQRKAVV